MKILNPIHFALISYKSEKDLPQTHKSTKKITRSIKKGLVINQRTSMIPLKEQDKAASIWEKLEAYGTTMSKINPIRYMTLY